MPILLLLALNAMIDITTTRTLATQLHPPRVVFVMLFGLALAASLLAGYGMTGSKVRSRFHMLGFALVMAVAVYVILDIEYFGRFARQRESGHSENALSRCTKVQ